METSSFLPNNAKSKTGCLVDLACLAISFLASCDLAKSSAFLLETSEALPALDNFGFVKGLASVVKNPTPARNLDWNVAGICWLSFLFPAIADKDDCEEPVKFIFDSKPCAKLILPLVDWLLALLINDN